MAKHAKGPEGLRIDVPYYAQTTDFTCGPACLLMALKYLDSSVRTSRVLELNIWKEATLIYTTSGLGGSGPYGLAVAAARRGRSVHVRLSDRRVPFTATVRKKEKKEVIRLLHRDLERQAAELGVTSIFGDFRLSDLATEIGAGMVPIVLISTWRMHAVQVPHWVVLTGYDSGNVYFHDPSEGFYSKDRHQARDHALPIAEFDRMRRHTKDVRKAAVLVGP